MTCTREEEDRITYRHVPQDCLWMESSPHRLRPCDPVQPGGPVPFAVTLNRKRNPEQYPYTLNGHQLKHVDVAKYLGVQISHDLHWDKYIEYITSKANSTLGFLRRNININNPQIKEHSYKTLVRQILEYSQSVWDPYTTGAVKKVESVQRRAARYTLNRYSPNI